ncbi:restriction endonuclease subunit S [Phascolarctobacterium succinatutens]|uniref:restriction endonuclease subunit S n=1 Tax=Phascolarctobacterium succinatutens TaxID=626940 RepID=UPI0026EB1C13|nr:restriction endonuclease subunit S [Phascolarctobacterium succinatutens]
MSSLSEVCKLIVDCPHSTARNEGEGYPLIRTPNIGKGRFNLENVHRVSEEIYNIRNTRAVPQDDDLILAREAPAGNVAIIKNGDKFCLGQRTVLIRPDKGKVNPDFLVYYLLSPEQQNKLLSQANGSTVDHVNLPIIRNLQLSLPPLPVQQRIASILSAYDDIIENNQKQIKLLEEAAQRLYKEWFVDLRFPGHESVKIVDGVPEGWSGGKLIKLAEFKRGKTITKSSVKEGNVPVIAGGLEPAYFHNVANTVAPVITVSASGANAGYTALHNNNVWASDCSFIDSRNCEHIYYVYNFLKTNKNMMLNLQKGSAQPHVYAKNINELILLIPKEKVLKEYSDKVEVIYKAIFRKNKQISSLREARDRLLPKLMSGEIEV